MKKHQRWLIMSLLSMVLGACAAPGVMLNVPLLGGAGLGVYLGGDGRVHTGINIGTQVGPVQIGTHIPIGVQEAQK